MSQGGILSPTQPPAPPTDLRADLRRVVWLGLFPISPRSDILNHALRSLRRGNPPPATPADLAPLLRQFDPSRRLAGGYPVEEMVRQIDENPDLTLMFCEWVFEWNALTQIERDRQRADASARYAGRLRQPGRITPEQAQQIADLGGPVIDPEAPDAPEEDVADFDVIRLARRRMPPEVLVVRRGGR